MTMKVLGRVDWGLGLDKEGHREYNIRWLCQATSPFDGPQRAFQTIGLPLLGSGWTFGNDNDPWARCWPNWKMTPVVTKEPDLLWFVDQIFTTKPLSRCQDVAIDNPLAEPPKLSGSFINKTKEATHDKEGEPILSSSHERIRGSAVEMNDGAPTVNISFNSLTLPLGLFTGALHTVNDATLWDLPPRWIELADATWERNLYGTCTFYYTLNYVFQIHKDTIDKTLVDEGSRVLAPGGDADNPEDFIAYVDKAGEAKKVILDGSGAAWTGYPALPGELTPQIAFESNLLMLGIPSSLI